MLDRASIQQSLAQWQLSQNDFQAADKAIDMLDLAHNAGDSIGTYMFSDSAGKYVAPPYEKLLINTLNMIDYLEVGDLSGAKIEARRLAVIQKYYADVLNQRTTPSWGWAGSWRASRSRKRATSTRRFAGTTRRSRSPATTCSRRRSRGSSRRGRTPRRA